MAEGGPAAVPLSLDAAGGLEPAAVLERLGSAAAGLTGADAARRLEAVGPNAVRTHAVRPWAILGRQLRSPLLGLLVGTAAVSFFVGERSDAVIIGVILAVSVGLGFANEYRAARAAHDLHSRLRSHASVTRDGTWREIDVTELVPGDVVRLQMGEIVPADARLLATTGLTCGESVLTGEALPVDKDPRPVAAGVELSRRSSCVFMGTVVHSGGADAVVVATGSSTEFGRIAVGLGEREPETEFQRGLRHFSGLLVRVAAVLSAFILVANLLLARPLIDALLFSLAIAVGITPQLLPAIVTTSLALGSRRMAEARVLVKRLVCIEDLGDVEVLLTDKTGTLTEGSIAFRRSTALDGTSDTDVMVLGLVCNEAVVGPAGGGEVPTVAGGNPLDVALWQAPEPPVARVAAYRRLATVPFDHERRRASVLVDDPAGRRRIVTKGAPEGILAACRTVPPGATETLQAEFRSGSRVVAVATREAPGATAITADDERDLDLAGFLVFLDPPKADARESLARLADLGIRVKVVTGDNPEVARTVCEQLGLAVEGVLTGADVDRIDDASLPDAVGETTIFARVSPEQKARIIRATRAGGRDVAFLGDGVNDAVALHAADVGISVDTGTDVAKDAADIILLEKDLGVLADGVVEGRRTFANTIKYVLMGTSSNFGNMFSAAAASAFLSFLPMLPSQILLNNLLYDASEIAIPTDHVDEEMLRRPSHWDVGMIRRFMMFFGPISSLFDFLTFAVMLGGFHASASLFRSGWFVESLATQTLVIFVIRTRRVPFFRSRASRAVTVSSLAAVTVGALLPMSPFAHTLGFVALPLRFFGILVLMVLAYLVLVEIGKRYFFVAQRRLDVAIEPLARGRPVRARRIHRRASRWSHPGPV